MSVSIHYPFPACVHRFWSNLHFGFDDVAVNIKCRLFRYDRRSFVNKSKRQREKNKSPKMYNECMEQTLRRLKIKRERVKSLLLLLNAHMNINILTLLYEYVRTKPCF